MTMYSNTVLMIIISLFTMCMHCTFATHNSTSAAPARCQQPLIPGSCRAWQKRYGYDAKLGECRGFMYGGCGGNSNSFATIDECLSACNTEKPHYPAHGAPEQTRRTASTIDPCAGDPCGENGMCIPDHTVKIGYHCACSPYVYGCPDGSVCSAPCEYCEGICVEDGMHPCEMQAACGARGQCLKSNESEYDCQCGGLAGFECPEGMQCETPVGCVDCFGVCKKQESCAAMCNEVHAPVCASNGRTYTNECFFDIAKCIFPSLSIRHEGKC